MKLFKTHYTLTKPNAKTTKFMTSSRRYQVHDKQGKQHREFSNSVEFISLHLQYKENKLQHNIIFSNTRISHCFYQPYSARTETNEFHNTKDIAICITKSVERMRIAQLALIYLKYLI
jgi:hypothetical protein